MGLGEALVYWTLGCWVGIPSLMMVFLVAFPGLRLGGIATPGEMIEVYVTSAAAWIVYGLIVLANLMNHGLTHVLRRR